MRTRINKTVGAGLILAMLATFGVAALSSVASAQPGPDHVITKDGIGKARVGSTAAQLRMQLGTGWTVTEADPILVDLFGYEVKKNGERQFWALGDELSDRLHVFVTDNEAKQTAEGVGPGTSIDDAVDIYGAATISTSENESREFVRFANQPEGRLFFRTGSQGDAGIYADGATETTTWKDGASITAVWVTCVPDRDCPELAYTGSTWALQLTIIGLLSIMTGAAILRFERRRRTSIG